MARAKFVFIGVSTAGSAMMRIFPQWARMLALDCELVGLDLPLRSPAARYRAALQQLLADDTVCGALVTAHKLDIYAAGRDSFAALDADAQLCQELSCIVKRDGQLYGYAKDPAASRMALADFVPAGHWQSSRRDLLCLGAGGAATAISVCMAQAAHGQQPRRFLLSDIDPRRLAALRALHQRLPCAIDFHYHHCSSAADNSALLASMPPGSLVINATGLGKDLPGTPLSDDARFPEGGLVWELNYRGERTFMRQAAAQAAAYNLTIEDGWRYFLHGWAQASAEVFALELGGGVFQRLAAAAADLR